MRDLIQSEAKVALPATLAIQSIITMAAFSVPVVAPAAAPDIGIPAVYVGGFTAVVYLLGMGTGLFAGTLVAKLGTIRLFQALLLFAAAGLATFVLSTPLAALLGAIAIGCATGPMNPTGSHILARTTPKRWMPLVFSVKQTATPAGGMLAGVLMPPLLLAFGWQEALLMAGAAALVVCLAVTPLRPRLDADRQPGKRLAPGAILLPLRLILSDPPLRALAIVGFAYAGAQITLAAYLVVYLTERVGTSIAVAGVLYAIFSGCGIPIRIVWGAIADRLLSTRAILILTGLVMPAGFAATASFGDEWPILLIGAVVTLLGLSANGWVGLFFAESVQLAPEGTAAEASGGAQFFAYGGIMSIPLVFGAVVAGTGSYAIAFYGLAGLCLAALACLVFGGRRR